MIVLGHRGAAGLAPENTASAVAAALAHGADGVEIDVRLLDGRLIVLHDETLERTTSGRGHYKSCGFDALRALDAGGGERVPVLEEIVELIDGRCVLNVEVKEAGIAAPVVETLERCTAGRARWRPQVLLSSFDADTTRELAALRGDMRLGILFEGRVEAARALAIELGACSVHLPLRKLSRRVVRDLHAEGLAALVYTVNDPAQLARCAAAGVDGIFTDYPDRALAFEHRTGKQDEGSRR